MKKKFLICTLCLTIIFSSLNITKASSLTIGKISIIYSIGRIALDAVGTVGDIGDVFDLGRTIYDSMTSDQKDKYEKSVEFNSEGFTYDKDVVNSIISNYLPSKGYHFMVPFKRTYETKYYKTDGITQEGFNKNKRTYSYQGVNFDILTFVVPYSSTKTRYRTYYALSSNSVIGQYNYVEEIVSNSAEQPNDIKIDLYVDKITSGKAEIYFNYYSTTKKINSLFAKIEDICNNCPHDVSLKDRYDYPSNDELSYIKENYPQYENDIPSLINPGIPGNGNGGNGGNGGNENINNPVISNPPSFPNLEEFNFNALQLEPLTNLFSNFKTKFPFSLPFDLANLIGGLSQDPIPPRFETEIFNYNFVIDFTEFEVLAQIVRAFTLLSYVVSLIFITRNFGG